MVSRTCSTSVILYVARSAGLQAGHAGIRAGIFPFVPAHAQSRMPPPRPNASHCSPAILLTLAPSKHLWKLRAALAVLTLAAYANSFGLGFVLDAHRLILEDPRVHAVTAANLRAILGTHYWYPHAQDRLYRPLATLSFLFNYSILGNAGRPTGYHLLNFLLHAVNVLLLFELARRLFLRIGVLPAFFAAALWAVHPVGTESISNLAGRADLLSTLGVLSALVLYTSARPLTPPRLAALFACSLAGFLSKESAAVLPALMLLCDLTSFRPKSNAELRCPGRGSTSKDRLRAYAAVLSALALVLLARGAVFRATAIPEMPFVDNPLRGAGFFTARLTAVKIIGMDLLLLLWPANLAFDHSYNQIPSAHYTDPAVWLTLVIVAEILVITILRRRRDPLLFFAAGWIGIALLPTSNLVQLIGSIMAVRFLYLPAIGFALAVSALAFRLPARSGAILMTLTVLLCAARTFARNPAWQSDLTLASTDVHSVPNSFRVHGVLASALFAADPVANLEAALREAETSWSIEENLPPASRDDRAASDLATYCRVKGDRLGGSATPAGRAWYERALELYQRAAETGEARMANFDQLQLAHGLPLPVRSGYGELYLALGETAADLGQSSAALAAFRNARIQAPNDPKAYDLPLAIYSAAQNWDALAVALEEKALVFGTPPPTLQALAAVYARIPGAACAFSGQASARRLDYACPAVKTTFCRAAVNLTALLRDARLPAQGGQMEATAAARGCP